MGAKARLETVLTGDDSPFVQAVNRAEKRAETFTNRVQTLFRRTPEFRAERALSSFAGTLATGDIQGAITSITERMSGLGLAAGVGIGAAIIVFDKARQQIEECDKAMQALNRDLARPLSAQSALGPEGIGKEIESTTKHLEDLDEKRKRFFQRLRESAIRNQPGYSGDPNFDPGEPDRVPEAAKAAIAAEQRLRDLSRARADAELDLVNIREQSVHGSERESDLAKAQIDYDKKLAALQLERGLTKPGRDAEDLLRSSIALKKNHELDVEAIGKRFDLIKMEQEVENRILNLHASSLSKDQQRLVAQKERIDLLKKEEEMAGSVEEKTRIGTQIHRAENDQIDLEYREYKKPWQQRTDEMMAQRDYQNFVKRQTPSNPNAYLSHPDAYNRRDILGNKIDEAGNVIGPGGEPELGPQKDSSSNAVVQKLDQILNFFQSNVAVA